MALPNEKRGADSSVASFLRSTRRSSSMTASQNPPFLSLRKRLLQCPPGRLPRSAVASATVKTGGCEYVRCAIPSASKRTNSSSGVIDGGGIVWHDATRLHRKQGLQTPFPRCHYKGARIANSSKAVRV